MTFSISKIFERVYCVTYPTLEELSSAFVRMQEFYDGTLFKHKIFEWETFVEVWSRTRGDGVYNYPTLWNGYNIPGSSIEKWRSALFQQSKMRENESELLEGLSFFHGSTNLDHIYLFGVSDESSESEKQTVIEHETAHAFYSLYPRYRWWCNSKVNELPSEYLIKAKNALVKRGYHRVGFNDEIQAYLSTEDLRNGVLGIKTLAAKIKGGNALEAFASHYNEFKRGILEKTF